MTAAIVALLQISSSHQAPADPPPWVTTCSATSASKSAFLRGTRQRRSCGSSQKSLSHWNITQQEADDVDGGWRLIDHPPFSAHLWTKASDKLSSDASLIPRPWGQEVGLRDKSHFFMHMSAVSSHFASSLTLSSRWALVWNESD